MFISYLAFRYVLLEYVAMISMWWRGWRETSLNWLSGVSCFLVAEM